MAEEDFPPSGGVMGMLEKNSSDVILSEQTQLQLFTPIISRLISAFYILVLCIGLPANGFALWAMVRESKKPSTIFLMNLAVADLLLSLVLPFKIHYHILGNNWLFGEALCRTVTAFFYGNMYCSVLLLTFISIDRYFALVHPFLSKRFRDNSFAVGSCCVIWVIVVLSVIPFLLMEQSFDIHGLNITTCHDVYLEKTQFVYFYYWLVVVIVGFLIPSLITIFCHSFVIRALTVSDVKYKKAARVTLMLLFVYLVCFTPSNTVLLVHQWIPDLHKYYSFFLPLSTFNGCFDPFLYYYVSEDCRNRVKTMLRINTFQSSSISQRSTKVELTTPMFSAPQSSGSVCHVCRDSNKTTPRMEH
ncbi:proteinase-activated receptor 3-like [Stegostoma tigrinum]|uniref:proteinase-activated receptor 3-like n=1 Tax=Stegostoma tigrinum TaxID=3053191 RepID=UPI0028701995|nr:proteinase-activated receptor 3-like [Stegostoma tigrinum]